MNNLPRDIDDWMFHFERRVSPALKQLFESELNGLPPELAVRLQKLREMGTASPDLSAGKKGPQE